MNKLIKTILVWAMVLPSFGFAAVSEIPNAHDQEEKQIPVYSCAFHGELVRFKHTGLLFVLKGANGNPDGIIAKDTEGKMRVVYFTKDSPYKCSFVYENEG